jgi:hypothetical protein
MLVGRNRLLSDFAEASGTSEDLVLTLFFPLADFSALELIFTLANFSALVALEHLLAT